MKNDLIIYKIENEYVGYDCIQIMVPYKKSLTIWDTSLRRGQKVLFCDFGNHYVNEYIDDKRRFQFPYSNIPIHNRIVFFQKVNYVNQLFDFETTYLIQGDIGERYCKAIKDGDTALLIQSSHFCSAFNMTANELKHLNVHKTLKPKIKSYLNKGFTKEDISREKQKIKKK